MTDQTMVVDAVTVDGRHVDPYSEATAPLPNPGRERDPGRASTTIRSSSTTRAASRIRPRITRRFIEWILAYHERTGNPKDRIVSFDA